MKMLKKNLKYLGYVLTVLSLGFIGYKLSTIDFSGIVFSKGILSCLLLIGSAVLIYMLSVFILGLTWSYMLKGFSADCNLINGIAVYSKANIGKYIPGSIFQYIQRNLYITENNISGKEAAFTSLCEIIILPCSGLLLGILLLGGNFSYFEDVFGAYSDYIYIAGILGLTVLIAAIVFFYRKSHKDFSLPDNFKLRIFIAFVFDALALLLMALALIPLASVIGITISDFHTVIMLFAAQIISWLGGFVVIGAPGGIGIKEFLFALIVADTTQADLFMVLIVLHRIISIAGDFFCYMLGSILDKKYKSP